MGVAKKKKKKQPLKKKKKIVPVHSWMGQRIKESKDLEIFKSVVDPLIQPGTNGKVKKK